MRAGEQQTVIAREHGAETLAIALQGFFRQHDRVHKQTVLLTLRRLNERRRERVVRLRKLLARRNARLAQLALAAYSREAQKRQKRLGTRDNIAQTEEDELPQCKERMQDMERELQIMRLGNTKLKNENDELRNDLEESERSLKMEVDQI